MTNLLRAFSIGVAALMLAGSAIVSAAEPSSAKHQVRKSSDVSARRHYARVVVPADDGYYYDRPVTYRPYPHVLPAPFPFGIGFDP
jgi:hypothetical protein